MARPFSVRLRVATGPDRGKSLLVGEAPIQIGRSSACDLQIFDREASASHCEVWLDGEELHVRDLGSRNGTRIDGERTTEAAWPVGVLLRIGATEIAWSPEEPRSEHSALLGQTRELQRLRQQVQGVAASDSTVLIEGETGTGKELVAEEIHRLSKRSSGSLVVVDCGCLPPTLVESELFGHEKGAFTGASAARRGAFEEASGGTLFLDELGELPLEVQPALLRALENRTARRLGASKPYLLDVRVVAATHRDLPREVEQGRFRADLYYRVAVVRLRVPPLRERVGDIALLATHFLAQLGHAARPEDALFFDHLRHRAWPGNVRELRNAVERAVRLGDGVHLRFSHGGATTSVGTDPAGAGAVAPSAEGGQAVSPGPPPPYKRARAAALSGFMRDYVLQLHAASGGTVGKAAQIAGVDASYVRRWFRRHCGRGD